MHFPEESPFEIAHKPVEDGFPFEVETDSLADSMGLRMPNRSLYLLQGKVGAGKSLISQRLVHGMVENGVKVLVITTELTTRGWIEQTESIGYGMTEAIRRGQVMVLSRYGTVADARGDVSLGDVLASPAVQAADVIVLDSASSLMPTEGTKADHVALIQQFRKIASDGRSFMLCADPEEMDASLLHSLRASAEVVLDLENAMIGGEIKRNIVITRFLRAAGPIQTSIGWRVEPAMGFIVDITAVS
jgi:flagellar protein FlaH